MLMFFSYFFLGAIAGTLSGLLGISGGIVVVPGLAFLFSLGGMPSAVVMHMAAGTSLSIMVFTTGLSLRAHSKKRIPFWDIYRRLLPGVIVGVIGGVTLAHFLHSNILSLIFGIFLLIISIKMLFERRHKEGRQLPGNAAMSAVGFAIGAKSGLLGVGGGALTVPFLSHYNVPMRTVVIVSLAVGLTVALIGSFSASITGLHAQGLPSWSTGYIYWVAWLPATLGSTLFAPIGAKLSHYLSVFVLKRIFAVFLFIVAINMFFGF